MKIVIDNQITIGEDSTYKLTSIQGISSSNIRTGSGLYAGRDFGFVSGQFLGYRTIVINGFYIGSTCDNANSLRKGLFGTLEIRREYTLSFQGLDSFAWLIDGVLTDMKSDFTFVKSGEFQLTFLCPDPVFYKGDSATTIDMSATWGSTIIGITSSASQTVNVPNDGNADTQLRIRWTGAIADFAATNIQKGQTFSLATMPSGETNIWFQTHRVTVGGVLYNSYINTNSQWFSIAPAGNSVQFQTSATNARSAEIMYRYGGRLGL